MVRCTNLDRQIFQFSLQIGPVIFLLLNEGFFNAGNDGQCMQKVKEREIICETYLVLVDDLRDDEECRPFDQMRVSEQDLLMFLLPSMTLAPLSTCPTK